jgi:hypothetical protein
MKSLMRMSLGLCVALAMGTACTDSSGNIPPKGTGGIPGSGGSATGGTSSTEVTQSSGGVSGSGGISSTGGISNAGGKQGTGGAATGGNPGSGGTTTQPGTGGKSTGGSTVVPGTGSGGSGGHTTFDAGTGGMGTGGSTTPIDGGSGGTNGNVYNPGFVEFYGADCKIGEPHEVNISTLPDLFESFDGTRISKKSDWRCHRAELKKAVEKYIHGEKPGRPDTVTGSVTTSSIKVHVAHGGKSIDFSVTVSLPSGASGPVPAIIGLGGGSLDSTIVKGEGVAIINYDNNPLSNEKTRTGLFSDIYGDTGASAQVGWAWGVSRIIDVLVDERDAGRNKIIDPTAIGVTGCSRLGKGAFTIGAFDERIALGIPQESGTGGVSAFRIVNESITWTTSGKHAQSLASAWTEAPGWFGTVFGNYKDKDNVNAIPVDTHSIVAMYAPRGLLVLDNSRIGELCATCQHGATAAGAEVYKALGVEKNVEYHGGNPSDPHDHCTFYPATQGDPLKRAIRAFLTKKAAPDGRIAPAAVATCDLAKWIPWSTPTLTDDMRWDSPPLTSK